jgi:hypothetical protein
VRIQRSHPAVDFTIVPNETLRDDRLSYLARGILAELLSNTDSWHTTADEIWRRARSKRGKGGEGRDTVRAAFTELETAGYLYRGRHRGGRGRFATELHLFDAAQELQEDGTPIYFALAAQLATDADPSRRRSDLGKRASSQVAPTTDPPGVGPPGVGGPGVGQSGVYTKTREEDTNTKIIKEDDTDDENPGVLTSPVQVESNGNGQVKTHFDVIPSDFGRPAGLTDEQWQDIAWLAAPAAELAERHRGEAS